MKKVIIVILLALFTLVVFNSCKTNKKYNPKKCKTCPHF